MSENITHKLRSLEDLARRPGTKQEGELARERAIEIAKKYNLPCIFTTPGFIPPVPPKKASQAPPPPPRPTKLHSKVVALEHKMKRELWQFASFTDGKRRYTNPQRPAEEIHMFAHLYGEFSCQHFNKSTAQYRPAGTTPRELDHFFGSISYRHQLWENPKRYQPSPDDFMFRSPFAPPPDRMNEPDAAECATEATETDGDRTDVIEEMLGTRKRRGRSKAAANAKSADHRVDPIDLLYQ